MEDTTCHKEYMDTHNDKVLVQMMLEGDTKAFEALMHKHKALVYSLCYRLMRNKEDAEEMAQDTFIKIFQKADTFEGKSKFSTWIYTIAYRCCLNKLGLKTLQTQDIDSIEHSLEDDSDWELISTSIDRDETHAQIHLLLEQMKFEDRALLTFFYFDELSIKEIAKIQGYSESKVKVGLFRARGKLKELIEKNLRFNEILEYGKG